MKDGTLDLAQRLVDDTYKTFCEKANSTAADTALQMNTLARLFTDFSQNVLAEEKGYVT